MPDRAQRLRAAITTLVERFKLQPGGPYADLNLVDTAIVLRTAEAHPAVPIQKEVASRLGLPKTTTTSAVRRLERRGLISRGVAPDDARARTLSLTDEGRALAERIIHAQLEASSAMLEAVREADRDRFIEQLEEIARAVSSTER